MQSKLSGLFILTMLMLLINPVIHAQSGKYLYLDGNNQYMRIPNHSDFNVSNTESFAVTMWINVLQFKNNNARFIAKRTLSSTQADKSGYELWGANSSSTYFAVNAPNAAGNYLNSLALIPSYSGSINKWTHIAFVVNRTTGKMYQYIDGVEIANSGSKDISGWACNNNNDVYIGCSSSGTAQTTANFFNAQIDNVRIWKKAMSPADIMADKTASVDSTTPGLVAAYDFEDLTVVSTSIKDIKNGHHGSLVNFPLPGNTTIESATITQDINFTGRGNDNEVILKGLLNLTGTGFTPIQNIVMSLSGTTDINDIENIKIYSTKTAATFDPRNIGNAILLASGSPAAGNITLTSTEALYTGNNYIWITCKVKSTATEGNVIDATLQSLTTGNETYTFTAGNPAGNRTILLKRRIVLAPGDYNSTNYRIPAIETAADGSLVTLTDKRKYNSGDLPGDIDIVARRSTDGGFTWSEPVTVALGNGTGKGFGDAVIVRAKSGKLISLFVGGVGLGSSTPSVPIRTYQSNSLDNGITWSAPVDITSSIFGVGCPDPVRAAWYASFCGSGRGLCTRNGRVMVVCAIKEVSGGALNNYALYSDDEGLTWNLSKRAIAGGDEAKVVELNNGDILMSSRTSGNRLWAKSSDGGITWGSKNSWPEIWGNACDADIVRYTSTIDGFNKNRILHTLPNSSTRQNVTMWISYDEGKSWPVKKTICPGTSAYSSFTILNDGTIGVYLEEDDSKPYKMVFLNFSLDWLSSGTDTYLPVSSSTDMEEASDANKVFISQSNGVLTLNNLTNEITEMSIISVSGRMMQTSSKIKSAFDISQLPSGIYLLQLTDTKGRITNLKFNKI